MYLPETDYTDVIERQRSQLQVLSKALSKNKKKLTQVQKEIEFLTQPLNTDYLNACDLADKEKDSLGRLCQAMLNEIETMKRANQPVVEQMQPVRPAPLPPPAPAPRKRPQNLFPNPTTPSSMTPQSSQSPTSQPGRSPTSTINRQEQSQLQPKVTDAADSSDQNASEQSWQCDMCTFRNHPLMNKCECCENVRVLPGTVRFLPSRPAPPQPSGQPLGSRSAPQTPATQGLDSSPARLMQSLSTDYSHPGVPSSSSSEGNLRKFVGDVII